MCQYSLGCWDLIDDVVDSMDVMEVPVVWLRSYIVMTSAISRSRFAHRIVCVCIVAALKWLPCPFQPNPHQIRACF